MCTRKYAPARVQVRTHTETEGENTKRRVRVHRISEFAVYLGAFAVARGKTQTSAVCGVGGGGRGERAVIGGVVSLPLFQRVQRGGEQGMGAKWKKGLLAGL